MKKVLAVTAAVMVMASAAFGATVPRLSDKAGLISEEAAKTVEPKLNEISRRHKCDVAVMIDGAINGEGTEAAYLAMVESGSYGFTGTGRSIVLVIGMAEERGAFIGTSGFIDDFTQAELEKIAAATFPHLSAEDFGAAAGAFADACDELLSNLGQ